ncbi:heavy metal translocating P-type ATPase [Pseudogemmatithrix spongiicola]|uniref:P-type Zn(2+) transporter n=1 Tax=Pseudogemmatithrix spongiicola TaxID=3062599 RepID=A0AA49Q643_9BACT|nr:heavy metal translocating P-type ATPase [Gemmatimonadaceae bacterium 'strain 138']WKW14008.1 heavy metal translocating P-type ATPase [Gemmatimonadaceae bacterium 'strain 318']
MLRAARAPAFAVLALVVGGLLHIGERFDTLAFWLQYGALILLGAPVAFRTLRGMVRGEFAADVVAMLAIVTAIALREPVAGLVIVLMQTGGELLERYAEGRASAAVRELEAAAPRIAHRLRGNDVHDLEDVPADAVAVGDAILVRPGEMLPCDATVLEGSSSLDTSRVTGEPLPERVGPGAHVSSGVVNLQSPLVLRVTAPARESLYARIVDLVRTAQAEKAPIQRLADRWAVWFTPLTLAACAIAWWISGDVSRVLAVLVVATPCPLIIATPVAVIGGINRAARRSIVVRNGSALELLSRVDTVVFDKTGTLTIGRPAVARVESLRGPDANALLRLGAAIEVGSGHLLARSTVAEALDRGLDLPKASDITEYAGRGVSGTVDGRRVTVGERSIVTERHPALADTVAAFHDGQSGGLRAFIAVGDDSLGVIHYADRLRAGLEQLGPRLAARGLTRVVLLSGDHADNVAKIAREVGITEARGDQLPQDKVAAVKALEAEGRRVLMVGDGTNDAPALASATVGVALAAHGGGISAEAAGVVLLADDVMRVEEAVAIGQRTVRIAKQSIGAGLALSAAGMVVAALGYLPPTAGALVQEAIDIAVIVNALRAAAAEG